MKQRIEQFISNEKYKQAWETIEEYEKLYSQDPDIEIYRFMCAVAVKEYEFAYAFSKNAVKKMPYSADAHYNYAWICQFYEHWEKAYEEYGIALQLAKRGINHQFNEEELEETIDYIMKKLSESIDEKNILEVQRKKKAIDYLVSKESKDWEVPYSAFHTETEIIGIEYMDYDFLEKMFVAVGSEEDEWKWNAGKRIKTTIEAKAELQRVSEKTKSMVVEQEKEAFLPIIAEEENILLLKNGEKKVRIPYTDSMQFINYRIPGGRTFVVAEKPFRIGKPILIEHKKDRKKLVLNIFIDGLSQTILEKENMKLYMPYTYKFFEKGLVCTNAHTTGDWTYPAIASIVTGQGSAKHKMLQPNLLRKLDSDIKILFEYFKEKGYNTTKIGGNWRISPNYGYARGMNRVFYQHMQVGYSAEKVVSDVQEQMYQMRDTDQFIWMEIGELHMIADEINLRAQMSEFSIFENQLILGKTNSVKQDYNEMKIKYYLNQIKRVDRKLALLYQYIEDNYSDEDILISLFSDHGQSYLIKPEDEFLSKGRSNVAFMFRGNGVQGYTNEVISVCDYTAIMCQLAGITYEYKNTDAHLPKVFGGESEREFAVVESIHPGDVYHISLKGNNWTFYLSGIEPTTIECRVPLKVFNTKLLDEVGNEIEDDERKEKYTKYCLKHVGECIVY